MWGIGQHNLCVWFDGCECFGGLNQDSKIRMKRTLWMCACYGMFVKVDDIFRGRIMIGEFIYSLSSLFDLLVRVIILTLVYINYHIIANTAFL